MKNCLIKLGVGSRVREIDGDRVGKIISINLVPNGINNPELVASLVVEWDKGGKISATSKHFAPLDNERYEEFYPSIEILNNAKDNTNGY